MHPSQTPRPAIRHPHAHVASQKFPPVEEKLITRFEVVCPDHCFSRRDLLLTNTSSSRPSIAKFRAV